MSATRQTKWRAWPITWCCWRTARSAPAGRSAKPRRESTQPLALDDDAGVVIEGTVSDHDPAYGLLTLVLPGSALQMRVAHAPLAPGKRLRFKVQARDVSLNLRDDAQSSILNRLPVRVLELVDTDTAAHVLVRLDAGGNPLLARITRYSRDQLQLRPGQLLWAQIKSVAVLA